MGKDQVCSQIVKLAKIGYVSKLRPSTEYAPVPYEQKVHHAVTYRSILIGALLIPPNSFWIMQVEGVWNIGHSTCLSLMWHVILNLLTLILINRLLVDRKFPQKSLTQGELITIYTMLSLAGGIAGRDSYQILVPVMGWAFEFATPENEWNQLFHRFLPDWLILREPNVLHQLYRGDSTLYKWPTLRVLVAPVLWWSLFVLVLGLIMFCLNVLIRKQWIQNEKLSYPIIQLPLAITQSNDSHWQAQGSRFFRNRLLWAGFSIGGAINIINGIHHLVPSFPHLPVTYLDYNLGQYFTNKPWSAVGRFPFPIYPFVIAIGFFLPLDLAFSTWFFYLFRKVQQVAGVALGIKALPAFPYLNQQSTGAWLGLFVVVMWAGRTHFRSVFRQVFSLSSSTENINDESGKDSPMSYRLACIGILFGSIAIVLFCHQAGLSLWIIPPFFFIFFMLSIAITRARAELGPPTHELAGMNPGNLMVDLIGTRQIGANNLSIFPLFWFFAGRGYRGHLMPHQLECLKMAEQTRMDVQKLGLAMLVAIFLGSLSAFWALYHLAFIEGLGVIPIGHDSGVFRMLAGRLNHPTPADLPATSFMGVGMLTTFLLMFLRTRFLWWPLHPVGYALSMNFGIDYIWSCLIFSSIIKRIILSYGGVGTYRRAIPFFLGVILGEYVIGGFWSLIGVILQYKTYDFYFA